MGTLVYDAARRVILSLAKGGEESNFCTPDFFLFQQQSIGERYLCHLLRDIFGNPFRPAAINPAWLTWNQGTVVQIAQYIYEERKFEDLPILSDALIDAGCDNPDIIAHCRSTGPHVRGCWVLDLLLGKE